MIYLPLTLEISSPVITETILKTSLNKVDNQYRYSPSDVPKHVETLLDREKFLVTSNSSFYHDVFRRAFLLQKATAVKTVVY